LHLALRRNVGSHCPALSRRAGPVRGGIVHRCVRAVLGASRSLRRATVARRRNQAHAQPSGSHPGSQPPRQERRDVAYPLLLQWERHAVAGTAPAHRKLSAAVCPARTADVFGLFPGHRQVRAAASRRRAAARTGRDIALNLYAKERYMCGIAGGWWSTPPLDLEHRMDAALHTLRLRGPNDKGCVYKEAAGGRLALGHTRLAIIDLSDAANQPMVSPCGRYWMIFNGEIYNYRELREELRALGRQFTTQSDAEVLLAAWQQWGEQCLTRLEGMFALVIYDKPPQTLCAARDAFGIKPFCFSHRSERLLFASELHAILALRKGETPLANWQRSYDYLVHGDFDTSSETFFDDILALSPGHRIEIDLHRPGQIQQLCWWKPRIGEAVKMSFDEAAEAVREQFLHSVALHLRSDVPLGATLSGGIDSSAIVCAMRKLEPDAPLHTFSYVAADDPKSEERWVDTVNRHVGAVAHKVVADRNDLARDLERLIALQGEPFMSSSVYAQYRVYALARENGVTVTLEGQGADELLAGYS